MSPTIIEKLLKGAEVEWKPLGEIVKIKTGALVNKNTIQNNPGVYPVINSGKEPLGFIKYWNTECDPIGITTRGAGVGSVTWQEGRYFRGNLNYSVTIKDNKKLLVRYLFYSLTSQQKDIQNLATYSGIPALNAAELKKLRVPMPPLSVQKEIVRILDAFTAHTAELTAELYERKKQYNYYRDKLLTFSDDEVEWKTIEEIFTLKNGYTPSKSVKEYWTGGTVPWFRMEDLRAGGRILTESAQKVHINGVKGKLFPKDSIIMSTSATVGEHALILTDFLCNQRFTNFSVRERYKAFLDIKYVYYYFFVIDKKAQENTSISSFPSVQMDALKKWLFPIPPISVQKEIVRKLDSFSTLTTSISEGLPREIELRNKQYEYYRDQLLNFPKPENDAIKHNSTNR
ncbi:restriction endonuclease subunit S [uncultured Bartonella sp.]|uniref:restriction endonuclease subunit S n=1 Tax=uncultured Bartonella sp. TaxID=104108 RepID=UPI002600E35C|nr:restriction endonuclease subunit S [uncultured Bartonella sp.]